MYNFMCLYWCMGMIASTMHGVNNVKKNKQAVTCLICIQECLVQILSGTSILAEIIHDFFSPSRQMLGKNLILVHDHFHIIFNSFFVVAFDHVISNSK
jgi:hypothetical protein